MTKISDNDPDRAKGATDDERQPCLSLLRVLAVMGSLDGVDQVVAQLQRIGGSMEREGIFPQAGQVRHPCVTA